MARVRYHVEGGIAYFPGLVAERSFETEALPPARREELLGLFDTVCTHRLSSADPTIPEGAADQQTYVIEIQEDSGVRRLVVGEFDEDPVARELLERLRDCADQCEAGGEQ
ncbi:protealysin inhibitor emfourin [Kocuria turfanensis]|nr:protealysin inhibitor emfourin [Kocuria turfanensis]